MLELLTGLGLSASAGLNAWIPLLVVGLISRFTTLMTLPDGWQWLGNGWVLALFAALLVVELVADKVPVVDTVNDVLQTVIRPSSGGVVFGAGASAQTMTVSDPAAMVSDGGWLPFAFGVVIALVMHALKALLRVVLNTATAGLSAPLLSVAEDTASLTLSLVAVLLPMLVLGCLVGVVATAWWLVRRRSRRQISRRRPPSHTAG